ncbi:MAG: hypothetical protein WDO17_08470 [Alphaproteobacteria bacterium]
MSHLNLVFNSGAPRRGALKPTPFSLNGAPGTCCGCAKPFPMRDGRREAQLGQDGRLYCYNRTLACTLMAVRPAA